MDLDIVEIILLTSLVNSTFLLLFVFFTPKLRNKTNLVLTVFIFLSSLNVASWVIVPYLTYRYEWFCLDRFPVMYFLGPLVYLFSLAVFRPSRNVSFRSKSLYIGYLDVIATAIIWVYCLVRPEDKFDILFNVFALHVYEAIAVFYNGLFVYKAIRIFRIGGSNHPRLTHVFLVIVAIFFVWIGSFFADVAVYPSQIPDSAFYPLWLLMFYLNIYLAYHFLLSPSRSISYLTGDKKPSTSDEELADKMVELMHTGKLFRKANITLSSLSSELDVSSTRVTAVLREHFKMSYYDFINKYRVLDTINRFKAGDNKRFTIKTIAEEAGFRSKTTFIKAFKRETGMLPKDYIGSVDILEGSSKH